MHGELGASPLRSSQAEVASVTELRIVSTLLWDYIKQKLPPAEHDIVRNAVGESLVSGNEALKAEADALADIVADLHLRSQELNTRKQLVLQNPARFLVENELMTLLRRLGSAPGGAPAESRAARALSVSLSGRHEWAPRPPTAPSRPGTSASLRSDPGGGPGPCDSGRLSSAGASGRPLPSRTLSRGAAGDRLRMASVDGAERAGAEGAGESGDAASPDGGGKGFAAGTSRPESTRPSTASTAALGLAEMVKALEDRISAASIDEVAARLRDLFRGERDALRDDIAYLTTCMDRAVDDAVAAEAPAPSLGELRDIAQELRGEVEARERVAVVERAESAAGVGVGARGRGDGARVLPGLVRSGVQEDGAGRSGAGVGVAGAGQAGVWGGSGGAGGAGLVGATGVSERTGEGRARGGSESERRGMGTEAVGPSGVAGVSGTRVGVEAASGGADGRLGAVAGPNSAAVEERVSAASGADAEAARVGRGSRVKGRLQGAVDAAQQLVT